MKILFNIWVVLFSLTLFGAAAKESNTRIMESAIKPYIDSGDLVGAISVLYDNGVQETTILGWANREEKRPISMEQSFMQCSQTKGFCGVTIAILVEEGKISLDDPVSKYLPEFKNLKIKTKDAEGKEILVDAKTPITIRMVMNHTAGFPFEIPSKSKKGWSGVSLKDTVAEAAANPIRFEPATKIQYSNTGIDIGAMVVEVVTKKPWDVFLKERVLDPLGMKDTTFQPTEAHLKNSISLYYYENGKTPEFKAFAGSMPMPYNGPTVFPSAGAGLWTTANDQLKFYKMLMNLGVGDNGVRILKEETVKNLLATSSRPQDMGKYSLGLSISGDWFGHGGAWGTNCMVNWKTKQLNLWVVQGLKLKRMPFFSEKNKAANEFFKNKKSVNSDEYTGRVN